MQKENNVRNITSFILHNGGYARMKDFKSQHFSTVEIKRYVENGTLEKIKSGLYRLSEIEFPDHVNMGFIDVSKAVNNSVICLISALDYYELTTFNPSKIYIAVSHNKQAPKIDFPPVKVYYFRERFYKPGIELIETPYGKIKIYNKEKSVCDMFRYRKKLGEDLALEGLKNYVKSRNSDLNKLREYVTICQVKTVMMPYLKAIVG
jgi:predicted transcriptional regulator of viral defense system